MAKTSKDSKNKINWMWPATGRIVTGFTDSANLKGIDIAGKAGASVVASAAGKVVYAGSGLRGYGKLVIVKHNDTFLSAYAHNSDILVKEGQQVARGQKIAEALRAVNHHAPNGRGIERTRQPVAAGPDGRQGEPAQKRLERLGSVHGAAASSVPRVRERPRRVVLAVASRTAGSCPGSWARQSFTASAPRPSAASAGGHAHARRAQDIEGTPPQVLRAGHAGDGEAAGAANRLGRVRSMRNGGEPHLTDAIAGPDGHLTSTSGWSAVSAATPGMSPRCGTKESGAAQYAPGTDQGVVAAVVVRGRGADRVVRRPLQVRAVRNADEA